MTMILFIVLFLLWIFYSFYIKKIKYWKDKDVLFKMPLPIAGNMGKALIGMDNFVYVIQKLYDRFSDCRYFVCFNIQKGIVVIRDPELIKMITVKDFDTFPIHDTSGTETVDPLASRNIVSISDPEKWHRTRATLSPTFTSSKMRFMFTLINECAANMVDYYREQKQTLIKMDVKDTFSRYANDVIATTAFGIKCDSLKDKDNEFYQMGKDFSNFGGLRALRFLILAVSPFLAKVLKIKVFEEKITSFFRRIMTDNIRFREEQGVVRPDMIHLLMEAKKNLNNQELNDTIEDDSFAVVEESEFIKKQTHAQRELTDDDMLAQALVFFLAGFETASTFMAFAAMELAANPDVQNTLAEEISELYRQKGSTPSYEDVLQLKYLDMVISEALRKWTPGVLTDRKSIKPYTLEPAREGGKIVHLEKGTTLFIPIYCIHRDEKYYPKPDVFDPERFSQENKANIKPYTYLPFGSGPRNCIASRYALMESKIIFYHLLAHFEFVEVEETKLPLRLQTTTVQMKPVGGFMLGLKQRKC